MCRAVQGPEGMILPVRLDIPFAPAAGVERVLGVDLRAQAKRPHTSGPRTCWGVSPIRDPHALSRRCRSRCSSLGRMAARMCSAQASLCRRAWARNKQGPSPASCSRPRSHRTHQGCTSVPRLVFKYALRCRPLRQASPCRLWPSIRAHCFAALLILFVLDLCHTQTLLSA
jgi:hypothetical protein